MEGEEELRSFIADYYKSLFSSNTGTREEDLLVNVPRSVTVEMNDFLKKGFTTDEIKEALNSMGDLKAPGPDGMPAVFYKRFWDLVGGKVQEEILVVLNGGPIPASWNETILVLIPKTKNPERLKDLRPISLCNVVFKIVAKAVACRMKDVLPVIISKSQSAFVPGRMITDNILIAYETTHYMHLRKGGREGLAAVKLDMSKAYDRVEWSFLEKIMLKMGFTASWVKLIMGCVRSVSYRVKVNNGLMMSSVLRGVCGRVALCHPTCSSSVLRVSQLCSRRPSWMVPSRACRFALKPQESITCSLLMTHSFL